MTRTRVLFVSHSGVLAGAERCLVEMLGALDRSLIEPSVLVPASGPLVAELEAIGVPVAIVAFDRWLARRNCLPICVARAVRTTARLPALSLAAQQFEPEVIYTNSAVVPIGAILARLLRVPHIWHVRELIRADPGLNTPLGRSTILRLIGMGAGTIVAVSEAVRAQFPTSIRPRVVVIGDGVDVVGLRRTVAANYEFRSGSWPRLVAVSALLPQKGIEDLLAVAEELVRSWPDLELLIIGEGPSRAQFERSRSLRGLDASVTFRGYMADAPAVIRAATLTLSASHIESFGRVIVESVAVGTPVVATDTGAARSVLESGAGVVVPTQEPHEMAIAVDNVLGDPLRLASMRTATTAAADRFDVRPTAALIEQAICQVRGAP